jgi:hypothetical protein
MREFGAERRAVLQLKRTGTVSPDSTELDALGNQFAKQHCIHLPHFLDPDLLPLLSKQIAEAEFFERVHDDGGTPPPTDLCMKTNNAMRLLGFLVNDPALFSIVQRITGCARIGCFMGVVYRLSPGAHYDSWHDDLRPHRMIAMSINLSAGLYEGGVLQIRDRETREILHEAPNPGVGDAVLFRISPRLEHRVSKVEGNVPRTAYAGWFQSEPEFLSVLEVATPSTAALWRS